MLALGTLSTLCTLYSLSAQHTCNNVLLNRYLRNEGDIEITENIIVTIFIVNIIGVKTLSQQFESLTQHSKYPILAIILFTQT